MLLLAPAALMPGVLFFCTLCLLPFPCHVIATAWGLRGGQPCHLLPPRASGLLQGRCLPPSGRGWSVGVKVCECWRGKELKMWSDRRSYSWTFFEITWKTYGNPHTQVQLPDGVWVRNRVWFSYFNLQEKPPGPILSASATAVGGPPWGPFPFLQDPPVHTC